MLFFIYIMTLMIYVYVSIGCFIYTMFCIERNRSLFEESGADVRIQVALGTRYWLFSDFFGIFLSILFLWPFCSSVIQHGDPSPGGGERAGTKKNNRTSVSDDRRNDKIQNRVA